MLDRKYFEEVVPEQLKLMAHPIRMTVHVAGEEYRIRRLIAAHDHYAVFEVYWEGAGPERNRRWQDEHPGEDPSIYDQVAVPYLSISHAHLTAKVTEGEGQTLIGFRTPSTG